MAGCELRIICRAGDNPVILRIVGDEDKAPVFEPADASDFGEAAHQIREGCNYEYQLTDGYCLEAADYIIQSKLHHGSGRIIPNVYVGTLKLRVLDREGNHISDAKLEVQSRKTSYRSDYRRMLEDIADQCTDLLLQLNIPD